MEEECGLILGWSGVAYLRHGNWLEYTATARYWAVSKIGEELVYRIMEGCFVVVNESIILAMLRSVTLGIFSLKST